jgi:hypothetical protein
LIGRPLNLDIVHAHKPCVIPWLAGQAALIVRQPALALKPP